MPALEKHVYDKRVGENLKRQRLNRLATLAGVGTALGISFQQVQKYESGHNRISASKLALLSEYLNVPVVSFFEGTGAVL